ncbi:MAG: two-component regulator propeller domain-containing protein [Ginsengibacter sp.]
MKFIFILFFGFLPVTVQSQSTYNFSHIFLDKGLSDPRVINIAQDKYGYMWFGTPNGLNRFDGYSIKTFYAKSGTNNLPSSNILCLFSTKNGDLWVATGKGLVKYDFAKESFFPPSDSSVLGKEMAKIKVNDLAEDRAGNLYFACEKGIIKFIKSTNKWEDLNSPVSGNNLKKVKKLQFFSEDILMASTYDNNPFYIHDLNTHKTDSIIITYATGINPHMYKVEKINDSEVIAGLLSYGIVKINIKNKTYKDVPGVLRKNEEILYNSVFDLLKDKRGRYWLASYYFQLGEYLPGKDTVITYKNNDPYDPFAFESTHPISIFEDRQSNIWIGTRDRGVYYFNPDDKAVNFYSGNNYGKNSLQREEVTDLAVMDANTLFVGTGAGPSFLDVKTGKYENYAGIKINGKPGPLENATVALPDRDGKFIWIGSARFGLSKFDRVHKTFQNFSRVTMPYSLPDDGISNLLQLPDGNLLTVGFGNPGIFNTTTYEYFSFRNDSINKVLQLKEVSSISKDEQENILLATLSGKLYRYNPASHDLQDLSFYLKEFPSLYTIYQVVTNGGNLYLVNNLGVISISKTGKSRLYNLGEDKNAEQEFKGILPEGNALWIASNKKLGKLDLASGKVFFLGEKERMQNKQFYTRSLTLSQNSTILLGSDAGYYEIFPEKLQEGLNTQAPFLTAFRVNDKPFMTDSAISGIQKINLKYDENFFAFDMSNFYFAGASDIEYAYKLEGFDKGWQYIGNSRTGSYTNVPGGNYTLKIKAKNAYGNWNEKGQVVEIHVDEYFAKTWWFKVLLGLIFLSIIYAIYRFRINQINTRAKLHSDYEIKLNELENSALRTQMNPHFIFNSLNTINSFISLNETMQAHKYIASFSRLIRATLDHSRQRKILLENELEVLKLYIEIEQVRFSNKFEYEIIVADGIDASTVEMPPLVIQPFVENAILHGLLPAEHKGLLTVSITHVNEMLVCTIEDNGIGREKSQSLRNQHFSLHKSHGIEITLKRISLFNAAHKKEAEVKFTDLEQGTKVEIPLAWEESF